MSQQLNMRLFIYSKGINMDTYTGHRSDLLCIGENNTIIPCDPHSEHCILLRLNRNAEIQPQPNQEAQEWISNVQDSRQD